MKTYLKQFIPPIFYNIRDRLLNRQTRWIGSYKTWDEASKKSCGYDHFEIFEKVKNATKKVMCAKAVCERDSVLFDRIEYSWPITAALMLAAAENNGKLDIIDFGGSLGSSYYQNRKFINFFNVSWNIIEQPRFVEYGRKKCQNDRLKFYYKIEECIQENNPTIVLLSSVLQYLEDPWLLICDLVSHQFKMIVIDLTPYSFSEDIITVQKCNPKIYNASYACRFLDKKRINSLFESLNYKLLEEFFPLGQSYIGRDGRMEAVYMGQIWRYND